MVFLDPKSDIVFKKLFGNINHKKILMSFLNSVLERTDGMLIVDVIINDPSNVPETPLSKTSIVDVRCTDQKNNQYIIEMQVTNQKDYAARAQYYSSLALSRQLATGEGYSNLVPVIFVGILDFSLFKTQHYISHHFILDNETHAHELKHLEFHFVELEKFDKEPDELTHILDKWIYFLKHAVSLQKIPTSLNEPVLEEAFNVLAQGNWSKKELEAYDRYLDAIRSAASQLETAEEIGMAKGMAKGMAQGMAKGMAQGEAQGEAQGMAKGERKKTLEIAQELLDILDAPTIAKKTGLTLQEIEELKKLK